jgi:hypothetical protein
MCLQALKNVGWGGMPRVEISSGYLRIGTALLVRYEIT